MRKTIIRALLASLLAVLVSCIGESEVNPEQQTANDATESTAANQTGVSASETEAADGEPLEQLARGDAQRGAELYENGVEGITNSCAACHTLDGTQLEGRLTGPSLQGIGAAASERVSALSAAEYLRESIMDPGAYVVDGYEDNMEKGYKYVIGEEDLNDLVAFLLTQ